MDTLSSGCLLAALAATQRLVWLVPLLPLLAALLISLRMLFGQDAGDAAEPDTASLASGAALGALLLLLVFAGAALGGAPHETWMFGDWLLLGTVPVRFSFILDAKSLPFACLLSLIAWLALRFSTSYLHREPGFHRFFLGMSLFLSGMLFIVLAGNVVLTFVGWELAGLSSWLLIGYARQRPQATGNALFVFLGNRAGDAGFLLGIALAVSWAGTLEWSQLGQTPLERVNLRLMLLGFVLAAFVKSAQWPFSPWIARALEGPTPSSAVFYGSLMVHAGVYLLLRLEPMLVQVPDLMALLVAVGLLTALYAHLCALVQSDVKSALAFSTLTQLGLMVLACGLGWFTLAAWHLCLHAAWRAWQWLLAPAWLTLAVSPVRPVPAWLARRPRLYVAALQRFWIEPLAEDLLTRPTLALGADMRALDERVIDRLVGAPREEDGRAVPGLAEAAGLIRGHGLPGRVLFQLAEALQRFENHLLLSGGGALAQALRHTGDYMAALELLLENPRYLMLMVMATFVVIL